jgi:hypothetical protein
VHSNLVAVRDGNGSTPQFVDVKDWLKTVKNTKILRDDDLDPISFGDLNIVDFFSKGIT